MSMNTSKMFRLFCLAAALFCGGAELAPARAELGLPKVFGSHMVLQREMPLAIWGWAQPNETVTVTLGAATAQAKANERGEWKAVLPAMKAGGPFTFKVTGSSTVEFEDVMIGEVWLCSGQSNMEMGIGMATDAQKEIAAANYPGLRLLMVAHKWDPLPQTNISGAWKVCSPKTVAEGGWGGFSAAAYYFGRELHQKLGVTVGLIDSTWGGTRIEPWTPPEGFAAVPALAKEYELVQLADPASAPHQQRLSANAGRNRTMAGCGRARRWRTAPWSRAMPVYPAGIAGAARCAECHRALQRHDSSALSFRLARRDLVSGRIQPGRGDALRRAHEGAHRRLARTVA